ncbi:excisionase [Burkholderia anthina]|uniref:excisionase n=1 Tax=Burkholderia anthina TaxID=179879 RepID=UPI001AA0259D|nr:excisionase [Burkholderia anthina]QTD90788.1 excisionase [Burkholderia anthina]
MIAAFTSRYVTVFKFCEMTGYTEEAVKSKRRDGVWLEGQLWIKAPDGRILMDIEGYEKWVETARESGQSAAARSKSPSPIKASAAGNASGLSPRPLI